MGQENREPPDPTTQPASTDNKQQQTTAEGMGECEDPLQAHSEGLNSRAGEEHWEENFQQCNPHPKHQLTQEEFETSSTEGNHRDSKTQTQLKSWLDSLNLLHW